MPGLALDCVGLLGYAVEQASGYKIDAESMKQGHNVTFTDLRLPRFLNSMGCTVRTYWQEAQAGDFVVWVYGPSVIHTGIVTGWKYEHTCQVIHCCAAFGKVVEHNLTGEWRAGRRLYGIYNIDGAIKKIADARTSQQTADDSSQQQ